MVDPVTRRLNYYTGQFLRAEDFALEQSYHIDRQRRHNRLFHTPGIADGLTVEPVIGDDDIVVTPGTAVDGEGREIVLAESRTVTASEAHAGKQVVVVISYQETTTDTKGVGDTRWTEAPRVEVVEADEAPPDETHIRLARLTLDSDGSVASRDESFQPRRAGVSTRGEAELTRLSLQRVDEARTRWPSLSSGASNRVDIEGSLQLSGGLTAGGPLDVTDGALTIAANGVTQFKAGEGYAVQLPRGGWYRIAALISEEHGRNVRANAVFKLFDTTAAGGHSSVTVRVGASFADRSRMAVNVLGNSGYARDTFTKLRVLTKSTYDDQFVEVYVQRASTVSFSLLENTHTPGWSAVAWTAGAAPTGYAADEYEIGDRLFSIAADTERLSVRRDGRVTVSGPLTVSGAASVAESVSVGAALSVGGAASVGGELSAAGGVRVARSSGLSFDNQTRQMINLWSSEYGIGIQGSTQYARTGGHFAWYRGGAHHDSPLNPGGGVVMMTLSSASGGGNLQINGTLRTNVLHLGDKWSLSGIGDRFYNDHWLRLMHPSDRAYYGGFAADALYSNTGGGVLSDERAKRDMQPIGPTLRRLSDLDAIRFRFSDPRSGDVQHIGFSAQQLEKVFPEVVSIGPDGLKAVNYGALTAPIVEAVKELANRLDAIEALIEVDPDR